MSETYFSAENDKIETFFDGRLLFAARLGIYFEITKLFVLRAEAF